MTRVRSALLVAVAVALTWMAACGPNRGGSPSPPSPPPAPTPSPAPQNPCATVSLEPETATLQAPNPLKLAPVPDENGRWSVLDLLWRHRAARQREVIAPLVPRATIEDIGDISLVQDEGDLILNPNPFDLKSVGLRFSRNTAGGYDVTRIDATFRTSLGNPLTLSDDDSTSLGLPFQFRYFARTQSAAFVNSDGNITFEEEDKASTERSLSRVLTGPPRVALFFADLDPSAGGRVLAQSAADAFTVTWCGVRGFESSRTTTAQATLLADGTIELKFDDTITLADAIVALSPGHTGGFAPVDLSAPGPAPGGAEAVGERFAEATELDVVGLTKQFYSTHPDSYDQLVIWTDTRLLRRAFAVESTVANEIRGIGVDVYDASRDFGSGGRLRSIVNMDALTKYPDDPTARVLGENNTVSLMGQEVGHRWLAFIRFRDHTGRRSDALLGRDNAHWSFFFDSDASVMEGNDIEDLGGGSFRTAAAVQRFSLLDQYAMGLLRESEVPAFFYVESPTNVSSGAEAESAPRVGVTFNGTRRDVLIQDVVAVLGARQPAAGSASRVHGQAFIYLVAAGRSIDRAQVDKVDRIRREWETFFSRATGGRARAETRLRP